MSNKYEATFFPNSGPTPRIAPEALDQLRRVRGEHLEGVEVVCITRANLDALLDAVEVKPAATITTEAELEALPEGTVILDVYDDTCQKRGVYWCGYETAALTSHHIRKYLPAKVLHWGKS